MGRIENQEWFAILRKNELDTPSNPTLRLDLELLIVDFQLDTIKFAHC